MNEAMEMTFTIGDADLDKLYDVVKEINVMECPWFEVQDKHGNKAKYYRESKWISCKERLPEEGEVVVALEKGKTWDCMTFEGTAEWTEDERMWKKNEAVIRIDYWMPLPEPFREEGEEG